MVVADPRTQLADNAEITRLREQCARQENENERLRAELAIANANIKELIKRVGELAEVVAKGNDRIAELLIIVQRKKSKSKLKPKEPKAPSSLDDKVCKAFDDQPGMAGALVEVKALRPYPIRPCPPSTSHAHRPGSYVRPTCFRPRQFLPMGDTMTEAR